MVAGEIRALIFDVFGTVVDWRTSIAREGRELGARKGLDVDWVAFADGWCSLYDPAMARIRDGDRNFVKLDVLHRESLLEMLDRNGITDLSEAEIDDFNRAWHRLDPWPDSVAGLTRLKSRFIIATQSNGNIALMVNMAKRAGLPWDAILGAEVVGHYKPVPAAYTEACDRLGLAPEQVLMTAAHNGDLLAARACGLGTAFVARPTEYGPGQSKDFRAEHDFDYIAEDFEDLAGLLGC
ncbi:MAG: haloacid dehalogenase type II [Rhodospirillaceae bacterium]|nr:haloacid dehalogenase type II [Rhodospirillaceae bacterium]